MPVITIEAGTLTIDQKRTLAESMTKDASEVMKVGKEHFIVFIKENSTENIGLGGSLLSDRK